MKLSFNLLALIGAIIAAFFDYSISLGIILTVVALHLIKMSRSRMEDTINHADKFGSKLVLWHFIIVLIIMVCTLTISFLLPSYFNPMAVALSFIFERIYMHLRNNLSKGDVNDV